MTSDLSDSSELTKILATLSDATYQRGAHSNDSDGAATRSLQSELQSIVLTHGFVHGHIHSHKDHTHIHGHIHNHDHSTLAALSSTKKNGQQVLAAKSTPNPRSILPDNQNDGLFSNEVKFNEEIDEILQGCQLDACFDLSNDLNCDNYLHVNPAALNNCQNVDYCDKACLSSACYDNHNCTSQENLKIECVDRCEVVDDNCVEQDCCRDVIIDEAKIKPDLLCRDENCQDGICCEDHVSDICSYELTNSCDSQINKKPMLKDLVNNVYEIYENSKPKSKKSDSDFLSGSSKRRNNYILPSQIKRQKVDPNLDFNIHFPHICHSHISTSAKSSDDIHQSCFYTTIPNSSNSQSQSSASTYSPKNYEFNIQFNNFKQVDLQQCQWDNCLNQIDANHLREHIVKDHILEEYEIHRSAEHQILENEQDDRDSRKSVDMKESGKVGTYNINENGYQCEWLDCDFNSDNLKSLIHHIDLHKNPYEKDDELNEILGYNTNQLNDSIITPPTPTSFDSLSVSSMNDINYQNITSKAYQFSDTVIDNRISAKSEEKPLTIFNKINITSVNLCPQEDVVDPNHQCKWESFDDDGNLVSVCNKKHKDSSELSDHLINDHIGAGKSIYRCNWLGCDRDHRPFTQRQKIIRHLHVHTKHKPFKCEICGSSFAVDSMLTQHIRIHSGEKPFECKKCGKKFATSSSLSIHNRIHTGEKPLACKFPGCGKRFSESSNLTKHMRIHSREYKCDKCGIIFDKKSKLSFHVKTDHK